MTLPCRRLMAAKMGNGHLGVIEQDIPALVPGSMLVEVHNSLISPGTEMRSWRGLLAERSDPKPNFQPWTFGYSVAGVVLQAADGVGEFKPGDRVACIGGGASHTDYAVVAHNLCVHLPDTVTFQQASYGMLTTTALQAVRRGEPQLGERFAVAGLGIVGQLTARLYQLSGCRVIGWDTIALRCSMAKHWCVDAAVESGNEDAVAATKAFADPDGLDGGVIAFAGDATGVYNDINECLKCTPDGHRMGRTVMVGGAKVDVRLIPANTDVRIAARTGPGFLDPKWEFGTGYPPVFIRWTTRNNLALCMRLIGEGRLDVDRMTTHTIPLKDVDDGIQAILDDPDSILGVVLQMKP